MANFTDQLDKLLFTKKEQKVFLEDICTLIKDGIPAQRAITTVRDLSTGATKNIANKMLKKISEGQRISDSMSEWFPPAVVEIIKAGEEGGSLYENLHSAINFLAQSSEALTSFIASTIYPFTVFIMALILSVFLKHSVFNSFATIKPVATWPQNGQNVMIIATIIEDWWWLAIVLIVGITFFVRRMLINLTGEIRRTIDKLPLFSFYPNYVSARFMGTLGLLLANGVTFKQALNILQRNAAPYLAWHIYMMQFRLSGGQENIADVLDTGLINSDDIIRLKVTARGKSFEEALLSLGQQTLLRNTRNIQTTGKIAGGALLAIDALLAIYMIFAVYGVGSFIGT
jgi:type II secretory pathway component PulF